MKLDSAGRIAIPSDFFYCSNLEELGQVVFLMERDENFTEIFILPATEENLRIADVKEPMRVDAKHRISLKKVMKRLELTTQDIQNANLELEGEQLVIQLWTQPKKLSREKVIREFLKILSEEGKISDCDMKAPFTLQVTIELR